MDSFTQDLKARLEKATGQAPPWGDVNPLVVIGLTEAILDLGLNEEQIYQAIRSFARQLAAQVHPDRQLANVSVDRQKEILGAFDLLDSRENFARALTHFKTLRAEDRREVKILQQTSAALRHRADSFEAQFDQLTAGKKALADEQREWDKRKKEEPLLIPNLENTIYEYKELLKMEQQTASDAKKEVTRWSNRAVSAEYKVTSLERRLGEATEKVPALKSQFSVLKEAARLEKRTRKEQERRANSWARNSQRWQKKFEKSALLVVKLTAKVKSLKESTRAKSKKKKAKKVIHRAKKVATKLVQHSNQPQGE